MKKFILAILCSSIFTSAVALPATETTLHMPPLVNGLVSEGWGSDGTYWSVPEKWRNENKTAIAARSKRDLYFFDVSSIVCNYARRLKKSSDRTRAAQRFCGEVTQAQAYVFKAAADMVTGELCESTTCVVVSEIIMGTAHQYTIGNAVKTCCIDVFAEIIANCGTYEGAAAVTYYTNGVLSSTGNSIQVIEDDGKKCANVVSGLPTPNQCTASNL